jgi:recombinational DNA repair ATPase RecF
MSVGMGAAGAVPVAAVAAIVRPRIDTLSLQNFRGFPGIGNPAIKLGGNNLLVYGENGSGKSSIFYALDQFFSISLPNPQARRNQLVEQTNIYSGDGPDKTKVTIQFVGGAPIAWTEVSHPVDLAAANASVTAGAYRKAMLDYRALLDVNYKFAGRRINLFEAFVNVLLRDMAVPFRGSETELFRIWRDVLTSFPERHVQWRRDTIDERLTAVNAAVDAILPLLKDEANRLLKALNWGDIEISEFQFSHLTCNWGASRRKRVIGGQDVAFTLKQRGEDIENPHQMLNEARQSALALALYLAGRSILSTTMQPDAPKLMVLDDVLIGLDQSNRLPVLDLLKAEFQADWQIVLLTHDRVWFEMARAHLVEADWTGLEMFEGLDAVGNTHPVPRPLNNFDPVAGNIATARSFLNDNHEKAAAVHARMAFEQVLKKFCERKAVPVAFKAEARHLTTENLLSALKTWLSAHAVANIALQPRITNVEAARRVVLNAFSHSTPVTLVKAEIESAIAAVEQLHAELNAQFPK